MRRLRNSRQSGPTLLTSTAACEPGHPASITARIVTAPAPEPVHKARPVASRTFQLSDRHPFQSRAAPPAGTSAPLVYRPDTMPAWPEQTGLLFYPRMLYFAQRRSGLTPVLRAEE